MIFPDKLVSFQDSIIAKSVYILKELQNNELVVSDLFIATKEYFEDVVADFMSCHQTALMSCL